MASRSSGSRWSLVALVVVVLALSVAAGCGESDEWAGTWVQTTDRSTGLEIEKRDDGKYDVHDPDGSNAFVATVQSDGTLTGTVTIEGTGDTPPVTADVKMERKNNGIMFVSFKVGGRTIGKYDMTRE